VRDEDRIHVLVRLVAERISMRNAADVGIAARRPRADLALERSWIRGDGGVSATYLMNMLSVSGLLQPEAFAVWNDVSLEEAAIRIELLRAAVEAQQGIERLVATERPPREQEKSA